MIINETQYNSLSTQKMELREIFANNIYSNQKFHEYLKQEFPQSDVNFTGENIIIEHADRINYIEKINNAIRNFINESKSLKNKLSSVYTTSCAYNAFFINDFLYIEI
jgi:hypothetical protein